jgi:hypothetical protein
MTAAPIRSGDGAFFERRVACLRACLEAGVIEADEFVAEVEACGDWPLDTPERWAWRDREEQRERALAVADADWRIRDRYGLDKPGPVRVTGA